MDQLQAYVVQISGQLSGAYQSAIDACSVIAPTFNELSPGEQALRPHLFAAVQALLEMRSTLFPTGDFRSAADDGQRDRRVG